MVVTRRMNLVFCGDIGGDYIQCIDCDDFYGACQMHCFCHRYGYSQACEAAGADGDINVVDLFRLLGRVFEQGRDGGKELGTVSHRAGKGSFGEYLLAERYRHGACSAGGFNG